MKKVKLGFWGLAVLSLAFAGCMTPVTVMTEPAGATVYCRGSGRPSYRWEYKGSTAGDQPVMFRVPYNAIKTYAVWPSENGKAPVKSAEVYTKLLFSEDPVIVIKKP
jgi:hypothetical protein